MPVFTLDDTVKILHKNRTYSILFLHRCVKRGFIGRVERGLYYVKDRYNEYEIASHVVDHSYVSMAQRYFRQALQGRSIRYLIGKQVQ